MSTGTNIGLQQPDMINIHNHLSTILPLLVSLDRFLAKLQCRDGGTKTRKTNFERFTDCTFLKVEIV